MSKDIDEHPYKPFVSDESTKLIIGTIPPPRFCNKSLKIYPSDVDFYYGSRDNHFWDIVSEVFNASLTRGTLVSVLERKRLLEDKNIGICDIIKKVERKNPNSASDDNLIVNKDSFLDIEALLRDYQNVTTLIYTSQKVKSFMYKKTKKEHIHTNDCIEIKLNNKLYEVIVLPSPSPRNTTEYSEKIKSYQKALM